ncbi:QueT transporter family protein [Sporolactobacillus shoreae]|uniref:QueT transporter family protein n=1 Tax=Sporolactobacillus shoreae TaxID=1465501 RepID=A0A4Z0GPY3_9BACL|nr:QueT transporter family protein [Sporolactobacillus shoreae]TGA98121.1 QueT transporter family protein [Sporolactobacillus shoreae]
MKLKFFAINAVVAALYTVLVIVSSPIAYGLAQFRISEMLNHLIVFNKKFFIGILGGVIIANLFSPNGPIDLLFGTGQSVVALLTTIVCSRFVKNIKLRMVINILSFSLTMCIIAWELAIIGVLGNTPFLLAWLYVAAGEFAVMAIGAPIFYLLNKRLNFAKQV